MKLSIVLLFLLSCFLVVNASPLVNARIPPPQCKPGRAPIWTDATKGSWCLDAPCVITNDAVLQEATTAQCHAVVCSESNGNKNPNLGALMTSSSQGGKGICQVPHTSVTTYFCSPTDKIIVTTDNQGYVAFKSVGDKMPSAYFGARIEHGKCHQPLFFDQSSIKNDKLYVDCSGKTTKKCIRE